MFSTFNVVLLETFAITETINGKLLQGSLLPKAVTHQVKSNKIVPLPHLIYNENARLLENFFHRIFLTR